MEAWLGQIIPLTLVAFRLSGLFVFAPILSSVAIPVRAKVLLTGVLGLALFPMVPPTPGLSDLDAFSFLFLAGGEVIIGLVIGWLGLLPVAAAQLGGVVIGQQMGLSLATVFNPMLDVESDITGELMLQVAMAGFLAIGGLEMLFLATANSFKLVPVGGAAMISTWSPTELATGLMTSGFEVALRVSAPIVGIMFVETLVSAMLMKTIPQINILTVGFGLKVLLGLFAMILALRAMDGAIGEHIGEAGRAILLWSSGGRAPLVSGAGAGVIGG